MSTKGDLSRITIDISKSDHKKLKAIAAIQGKSMREIVIQSIEKYFKTANVPNDETRKSIENIEKGKNLVRAKDAEDLFKKLGI